MTIDQRVRVLFRLSFDALALVDDDRHYLDASPAAEELFGTSVDDIVSRRIDDFTPTSQRAVLHGLWAELERRGALSGPYEMLRADGTRTLIEFRAEREFEPGRHLIAAREIVAGLPAARTPHERVRLTPREREILQLAADGGTTRDIADILILSAGTVKTHFEHIYAKLEVGDRAAAVARALRCGLID
jgi:PAS domain S-box-containing protein